MEVGKDPQGNILRVTNALTGMQQLCTGAARRKFLIGLTHAAAAEGSKGYDGLTF